MLNKIIKFRFYSIIRTNDAPTSKNLIISVLSVVTKPVTSQLPFFMLLYSFLFLLDIFFEGGFPVLTPCFKIIYGIFLCYLLVWPSVVLPKIPRRIYKTVVILVSTILFIVDIYLALLYGKTFGTVNGVSYKHKSLFK